MSGLTLRLLPGRYAVCRLEKGSAPPVWAMQGDFWSITRTADELSAVCAEAQAPEDVCRECGFRIFKIEGPLDFSLTGILAGLAAALAHAKIPIFALSTFDTDYILVKDAFAEEAVRALHAESHTVLKD